MPYVRNAGFATVTVAVVLTGHVDALQRYRRRTDKISRREPDVFLVGSFVGSFVFFFVFVLGFVPSSRFVARRRFRIGLGTGIGFGPSGPAFGPTAFRVVHCAPLAFIVVSVQQVVVAVGHRLNLAIRHREVGSLQARQNDLYGAANKECQRFGRVHEFTGTHAPVIDFNFNFVLGRGIYNVGLVERERGFHHPRIRWRQPFGFFDHADVEADGRIGVFERGAFHVAKRFFGLRPGANDPAHFRRLQVQSGFALQGDLEVKVVELNGADGGAVYEGVHFSGTPRAVGPVRHVGIQLVCGAVPLNLRHAVKFEAVV